MNQIVAAIILLPLLGAAINGILGLFVPAYRRARALIGIVACLAVLVPLGLTIMLFLQYEQSTVVTLYRWVATGALTLDVAYRIDELSLIMMLVVTGVGGIIHIYSIGYMGADRAYWKYFSFLNLFIFAMMNLIMSDNMVGLFLGWEGVGLCSYLLIGFWYTDLAKSAAAMKAFIVNRIGDFAFLIGMFILFKHLGALDFGSILGSVDALPAAVTAWVVFLFFIGATGKSAQIPLFVWLPDAMAGPTPVSALIHAATMVTSGLYLLARLSPLVLAVPSIMTVIATVGAATALMAATIAITQYDIKRVLAYSTVSQLGYMFLAAGVGAFFVAIFHVFTHAFFKACLFLGSGSVIHSMHDVEHELEHRGHKGHFDVQDMRNMGGLQKYMPATAATYWLSTLAIAGIPLFSGFFSKDEILFKTFEHGVAGGFSWSIVLWVVGVLTALLTAIYMTRSAVLTFHGKERWPHAAEIKPHESPPSMTIPLWLLAIGAVLGGFIGIPAVIAHGDLNWIHHWLSADYGGPVVEPHFASHVGLGLEWGLIALSSLVAIFGVWFAWSRWIRHGLEFDNTLARRFSRLWKLFSHKYYWDELYDKTVVRPVVRLAENWTTFFDERVIDGAVNGLAGLVRQASGKLRLTQTGIVQNYALALLFGVAVLIALMIFLA
jgi:NADH-quinone oxidoreductase subunit L